MTSMHTMLYGGLLAGMLCLTSGCNLLHELQPHRLWKLNNHPPPRQDPYFSVPDPIPEEALQQKVPSWQQTSLPEDKKTLRGESQETGGDRVPDESGWKKTG